MDIYLIDPEGSKLQIPVMPPEISIRREKHIETVEIINLGEIDFPKGERVKEISFSSFFPKEYDSSYCRYASLPDPAEAMNQLTTWEIKKGPIRLIISDTPVNALVLVSVHNSTFKGGEPDDIYFELVCRTWREVKVRTTAEKAAQTSGNSLEARVDVKPTPKTYTVKPGDNLWAIAKYNLGSGSKWGNIYDLNKSTIGPSASIIQPGMKLVMPT